MIELEILFSSGQGILVPFDDRETALRFMKQALDYNAEEHMGLYHLSTPYEELLIDFADICFIRLKKDNYPRIGATIKIPEQSSYHQKMEAEAQQIKAEQAEAHREAARAEQAEAHREAARAKQEKAVHPHEGQERHFTADPKGNVAEDPLAVKFERAEERLKQAEKHLDQVDKQRQKVEEQLKKTSEELEDAVREAELRKKIESIEIDEEITQMKERKHD